MGAGGFGGGGGLGGGGFPGSYSPGEGGGGPTGFFECLSIPLFCLAWMCAAAGLISTPLLVPAALLAGAGVGCIGLQYVFNQICDSFSKPKMIQGSDKFSTSFYRSATRETRSRISEARRNTSPPLEIDLSSLNAAGQVRQRQRRALFQHTNHSSSGNSSTLILSTAEPPRNTVKP